MKCKVIIAALSACLLLSSCGSKEFKEPHEEPYKVTLYSGGVVVREWNGVDSYIRWSDQHIEIHVDGETFHIDGGAVIIEHDKDDEV